MSNPLDRVGAITLFVDDSKRSKDWYKTVFEAPIAYEDEVSSVVEMENLLINLLQRSEASELIGPGTVAAGGTGSAMQFTIWVEDADAMCQALADKGVELLNGPMDRPWGQRTACFSDPDGHIWEIAQTIP